MISLRARLGKINYLQSTESGAVALSAFGLNGSLCKRRRTNGVYESVLMNISKTLKKQITN